MKKIAAVVSACVAVSTVLAMATTTYAATKSPTSHTVSADQSLLNQITALQKQLNHDHNSTLKNEVKKELVTYRADLVKEQAARKHIESVISTYDKTLKQDKGHDHGTIVKTTPKAEKILNSVKKTLKTDQSQISHDIQQTKSDITKGHLKSAVSDAKKADDHVTQLTRTFNNAAKGLKQIIKAIDKAASSHSSAKSTTK